MSGDRHEPFRSLLAERMDDKLGAADETRLAEHLAGCPACRAVARDYEADRARMRSMRTPEPPRDLWARTSAALDREVADDADALLGPGLPGRRGRRQLRVALGSLVTAMVILAITGGQLMPEAPTGLATATPFSITAQAVSYLGVAGGELTFYRADVAEVCPAPRLDCADGPDGEAVVRLGAGVHAREMTMSRTGQLFISGRDDLGEEVFAIVVLPSLEPSAEPDQSDPPSASADPGATPDDATTAVPTESRNPDLGQPDPPTPEPTDGPDVIPSPSSPDPGSSPSISPPPGPTTAVATSQAILTDALATGAAATWSPDGTMLAFSAMPADRSHGSDVYVWRPGDDQAQPVTDDHASFFASWSGSRIVASRIEAADPDSGDAIGQTVVIDPASGEARGVDIERAWLPTVDPTGRFVIYWRGRLADRDGVATPDDGRLYIADWTSLDPWPSRDEADPEDTTSDQDAGAAPASDESAAPAEPSEADGSAGSDASPATEATDPTAEPADVADASPAEDEAAAPEDAPVATELPQVRREPRATAAPFVMERPRAVSGQTRDWIVRWSADGNAYAVWTAEPDSKVRGSLMVRSAPGAEAPTGATLVERVRASRSFGLGNQRIVWVAPLANGHGELWVSVWGERGMGSVKLRRLDSLEAVPAN